MSTNRISVDMESNDHRKLKSYCGSAGITIKQFVLQSVLESLSQKASKKELQKGKIKT